MNLCLQKPCSGDLSNEAIGDLDKTDPHNEMINYEMKIIMDHFDEMYNAYFKYKHLIPKENFTSIKFEDLRDDTMNTVNKIYDDLKLGGWNEVSEEVSLFVEKSRAKPYQMNKLNEIDQNLHRLIHKRWARYYKEFGYKMENCPFKHSLHGNYPGNVPLREVAVKRHRVEEHRFHSGYPGNDPLRNVPIKC